QTIDDVLAIDPRAQVRRQHFIKLDAIGETGLSPFRWRIDRAQRPGAIELIVVAIIEMPGQPLRAALSIDFHDIAAAGAIMHVDDPGHRLFIDTLQTWYGMGLQLSEDIADRHMHAAARLDIFEDNKTLALEHLPETGTHILVFQNGIGHSANSGAEASFTPQ